MKLTKIGHWLFLVGVVLAVLTGLVGNLGIPNIPLVLVVLGVVVGLLNVSSAESRTFLIAGIAFLATASALNGLPVLGDSIAGISANLSAFTAPAVLIVAVKSLISTAAD